MPEVSQVHVDIALTNLSVAYKNAAFIAEQIAPPVAVRRQSDKYYIFDADRESFREADDRRAPGAEANEVNFALSSDNYYCADHALESAVPDEERDNADPAIQPDLDHTEFLMEKIGLNQEIDLAASIHGDPAIPGETLAGDEQWSDPDSDPIAAVEARKAGIAQAIQAVPNTLVLPYEVFASVRQHPAVIDRVKFSALGVANIDLLAQLFDVERVLVPRAVKNSANPGQNPSIAYVWGKHALLCYTPSRPAPKQPAFAYAFRWALAPGAINGLLAQKWREERRKADMIRVQKYYDMKLIAPAAAYLWKNAVA